MTINILMGILLDLMKTQKLVAQQLAEKYEVSVRSIYRYVDYLSVNNIPIYTKPGKNGGIFLLNNYHLDSMFFTRDDLNLLDDLLNNCPNPIAHSTLQKIHFISSNQ